MIRKELLNRRFIRLQAVQRLYAFYINKQANREVVLRDLDVTFVPDIFAENPVDPQELIEDRDQARALFRDSLHADSLPVHERGRVMDAVAAALTDYQRGVKKDEHHLREGLTGAVDMINRAIVSVFQLLVEWRHLADKHAHRSDVVRERIGLAGNSLLRRLEGESDLESLVQRYRVGWTADMPLVEDWYNQFIKGAIVDGVEGDDAGLSYDHRFLNFVLQKVIFGKGAVEDFFDTLDLNWSIHRSVVKRCVCQWIDHLVGGANLLLPILDVDVSLEEGSRFYSDLVDRVLMYDADLESRIAQKSKNWTLSRINVLDMAIIKLALCEMLYFPTIPTKVSLNEYIEIAKDYSIPRSRQFVNGVLDAIASDVCAEGVTKKV